MDKKELASAVLKRLTGDYGELNPVLRYENCFQLLISVILSAQTTDKQVNRVTPGLFRRYPEALLCYVFN